ncbi:hypothetical protein AB0M79_08005 [Polymorphospora sp. NPDC051019]|uniref:hypothetical protein n=1 Tax=Polymorphospora sp. NPDC051019 TaxID=3155725 RepID=UPI003447F5DE
MEQAQVVVHRPFSRDEPVRVATVLERGIGKPFRVRWDDTGEEAEVKIDTRNLLAPRGSLRHQFLVDPAPIAELFAADPAGIVLRVLSESGRFMTAIQIKDQLVRFQLDEQAVTKAWTAIRKSLAADDRRIRREGMGYRWIGPAFEATRVLPVDAPRAGAADSNEDAAAAVGRPVAGPTDPNPGTPEPITVGQAEAGAAEPCQVQPSPTDAGQAAADRTEAAQLTSVPGREGKEDAPGQEPEVSPAVGSDRTAALETEFAEARRAAADAHQQAEAAMAMAIDAEARAEQAEKTVAEAQARADQATGRMAAAEARAEQAVARAGQAENRADELADRCERLESMLRTEHTRAVGMRAAQERQIRIDVVRALADLAAEVEEIVAAGGDAQVLVERVRGLAMAQGLEPVGSSGAPAKFDPTLHESVGRQPETGATVAVVRPGYRWRFADEEILLHRSVVSTM